MKPAHASEQEVRCWTPTQTGRHFRGIPEWNIDGATIIGNEDEVKQLSQSILNALSQRPTPVTASEPQGAVAIAARVAALDKPSSASAGKVHDCRPAFSPEILQAIENDDDVRLDGREWLCPVCGKTWIYHEGHGPFWSARPFDK